LTPKDGKDALGADKKTGGKPMRPLGEAVLCGKQYISRRGSIQIDGEGDLSKIDNNADMQRKKGKNLRFSWGLKG